MHITHDTVKEPAYNIQTHTHTHDTGIYPFALVTHRSSIEGPLSTMVGRHYLPHRIHFVSLSFSLSTVMLALLLLRVLFFHFNLSFHLQFEKEMAKWNGVYNWCVQNVRIILNESELTVWCAVLGVCAVSSTLAAVVARYTYKSQKKRLL